MSVENIMMEAKTITGLKMGRIKSGIQQWRLASLVGISQTELSHYEVGRCRCPADIRRALAKILEMPADELFPEHEKGEIR